jgi:hypothetical protein
VAGWFVVGFGGGVSDLVDEFSVAPGWLAGAVPVREEAESVPLGQAEAAGGTLLSHAAARWSGFISLLELCVEL